MRHWDADASPCPVTEPVQVGLRAFVSVTFGRSLSIPAIECAELTENGSLEHAAPLNIE